MNFFARFLPPALVLITCCAGFGQASVPSTTTSQPAASQSTTAKVEMPSDPAALLELVAKKNGLQNVGSAPWHLKASYEVFDDTSRIIDRGTFEEFWISNSKSRSSYSSSNFNQILIANDEGFYREGDSGTPRGAGSLVRSTLFQGATVLRDKTDDKLKLDERTLGSVKLKCITVESTSSTGVPPIGIDCLDNALPVLRISVRASGYLQTLYGEVTIFQGIYVARNIDLKNGSKTILHVHIDSLEPYELKDVSLLLPGPRAVYMPQRVSEPGSVQAGNIVRRVPPSYPSFAKQQGIQGVVVLHATINREGKIEDIQPIIGPPELIPPSLEAVEKWQYRPYLLNGVPVEVETEINVVFCLSCW